MAREFGCQVGSMPFTCLGLPLGTTKPLINDLLPLVSRLERKLSSSSCFLPQGARLQLINSALASMPLHFLCTLRLPPSLTKQFDRLICQCLWRDYSGEPKQSLAAWDLVCKPKKCGGLGVVDFQKQNAVLLIKFLDKSIIRLICLGCICYGLSITWRLSLMLRSWCDLSGGVMS
jgi:hypothetical protein